MHELYVAPSRIELSPFELTTIPLDKSWINRMGLLNIAAGNNDTYQVLSQYPELLSDDILSLTRSSTQWLEGDYIEVGESGTLYRALSCLAVLRGEDRIFIKSGTLKSRDVTIPRDVFKQPFEQLLEYDEGTSQLASAVVLFTDRVVPKSLQIPYKLALSQEAKAHWLSARANGRPWELRKDSTIAAQALAYKQLVTTGSMQFTPEQSEDFCFALVYNLMSVEEGEKLWPQLRKQESNRFESVIEAIEQVNRGELITSDDHRVVQAIAMRFGLSMSRFKHPDCVAKSWPLFWDFRDSVLGIRQHSVIAAQTGITLGVDLDFLTD